jgi:sarcosine oxidase
MIAAVGSDRRGVVVGGGLLGLSAAWALSRRGWSVRVLEAGASVGHERCGSKGEARIFRLGYREAHYIEMALLARDLWRSLESASGRTLLRVTGQLSFGDPASVDEVARALASHGVPGSVVDGSPAAGRLAPGLVTHGPVLYEPDSGVLAPDACLAALISDGGLRVEHGRQVRSVRDGGSGGQIGGAAASVVMSDGEVLGADVVVVCAGPSSLGLVEAEGGPGGRGMGGVSRSVAAPASLPQVAYFRSREAGGGGGGGGLPVFIEWGDDMTYGLPVLGDGPHAGLFKVSHHAPGAALERYDPADSSPMPDDVAQLGALGAAVRRLLPCLDPIPVATERCVYDNSLDTDFVLDRIGSVVVGCGTSGHGFKFGPLLGHVLADLAEAVPPPVDLSPFRIDRPVVGSGS